MKHACETCGQKYAIPDARVAGRLVKIRCQKCSGVMKVDATHLRPGESSGPERRFTPSVIGERQWYVGIAGKACGPYTREELLSLVDAGEVRERTYLWRRGMTDWERVNESDTLAFVMLAVQTRESLVDEHAFRTPTGVFEAVPAALTSDGKSYFPDPTLHTGFSVLSDEARAYLEEVARREVAHQRRPMQVALALGAFIALTLLGAAGAWAATAM